MRRELFSYCLDVLGPCKIVADHSWPHGEALVLEVHDSVGCGWIVKRVAKRSHFQRELKAYRESVPALGDRAPALRAWNDDMQCLVVSALPGRIGCDGDPNIYRQAGVLTRLFHDSVPAAPNPEFVAQMMDNLEGWLARGPDLIAPRFASFAREQVARVAELPPVVIVPCHWDNHPRNWLVDDDGVVRFIDFGHARRQVWVLDFNRLYFGEWRGRPDLREAFLAGYGRGLTDDDVALLERCGIQIAVSSIVWAREHDDAIFEEQGRLILDALYARLA